MLVLVHRTMSGEPVGVWSDTGESLYFPGKEHLKEDGEDTVSIRGTNVPWSVFVDRLAGGMNFQETWSALDAPDLERALSTARTNYFTARDADTPHDR